MKRFARTSFIALIAAVATGLSFYAGCSDDTTLGPDIFPARAGAEIMIEPSLRTVNFLINAAHFPDIVIDSLAMGDSVFYGAPVMMHHYRSSEQPPFYIIRWTEHCLDTSDVMYRSGDTANITIWGMGRSSTARIRLLDANADKPAGLSPAFAYIGGSDTFPSFSWNGNPHVDWYSVRFLAQDYSGNTSSMKIPTTDTFMAVPSLFQSFSIWSLDVYVTAVAGPESEYYDMSWEGRFCDGYLRCRSGAAHAEVQRSDFTAGATDTGWLCPDPAD